MGDIVLVKDNDWHRNYWPMRIADEVYPSKDKGIWKAKIFVVREGTRASYVRPISELVLLVEADYPFRLC